MRLNLCQIQLIEYLLPFFIGSSLKQSVLTPLKFFFIFFIIFSGIATKAEDCPRGSLDKRFCDRDGDMLADPPKDPSQWIDPYQLVFSYAPVEDPNIYKNAWKDFIIYMEKITGKKVVFFPIQSNNAEIEAMRVGKLHIAGFNTGSNPLAVNCAGFHPFTIMAKEDGSYGYEMELITYPGSGIRSVRDIKGKTLAFTAPTSNSGFKAPSAILKEEFNLIANHDFRPTFSGKHGNSILGVVNKIYPVAAIANSVKKRMLKRGSIKKEDLVTIYKSRTFPSTGFGYAYNLKPELVKKIKKAFQTFSWDKPDGTPSSLKAEFSNSKYARFIPIDYKDEWQVIRTIDKANAVSYRCNPLY